MGRACGSRWVKRKRDEEREGRNEGMREGRRVRVEWSREEKPEAFIYLLDFLK